MPKNRLLSREAKLFVGWVSGSVTHAGVGFHASTQPTFILYLIPPTHLARLTNTKSSLKVIKGFVMRIKKQQIAAEASCKNRHRRINTIFQQMGIAYR
jgi:hypothetical protein